MELMVYFHLPCVRDMLMMLMLNTSLDKYCLVSSASTVQQRIATLVICLRDGRISPTPSSCDLGSLICLNVFSVLFFIV